MNIKKGTLAICGIGCLGLITEDEPKEITYPDGNKGTAYVGIHLTDKVSKVGSPWSSRNPKVVGHINDFTKPNQSNRMSTCGIMMNLLMLNDKYEI